MADPCNHCHGYTFLAYGVKRCNQCGMVFVLGKQGGWPTWKESK